MITQEDIGGLRKVEDLEKRKNSNLHKLRIENENLTLDDFKIKGLTGYKIEKNSVESPTELLIKIVVQDL